MCKNLDIVGGAVGEPRGDVDSDLYDDADNARSFPLSDEAARGVSSCEGGVSGEVKPVPRVKRFPSARHAAADR